MATDAAQRINVNVQERSANVQERSANVQERSAGADGAHHLCLNAREQETLHRQPQRAASTRQRNHRQSGHDRLLLLLLAAATKWSELANQCRLHLCPIRAA
jgi:hypothetical protein